MVWKTEKLLNTIFQRMFVFRFLLVLLYCYYLITPSGKCSLLIFVVETQFNINTLYKLLFMSQNNLMRDRLEKIFVYTLSLFYTFYIFLPISLLSGLRFILWSFPPSLLFYWPRVNPRENLFTQLRHLLIFLLFAFIEK